jgi:isopenicillin N synthase-like dioxygenase
MTTPFQTVPILPLSSAFSPTTKPAFLRSLRDALLNVGFLYLSETGLPQDLVDRVVRECKGFFDLERGEKERIEMKNCKSFLGWSRVCIIRSSLFFSLRFWKLEEEGGKKRRRGRWGKGERRGALNA